MLAKSINRWFRLVAFPLLGIGAPAVAWSASPTPISACPYTITAPGNYVVTKDLTSVGTCITLAGGVSNFTIDMQGHNIAGNGTGYGIVCLPTNFVDRYAERCNNLIIANGVVQNFSGGIVITGLGNTVSQITSRQNKLSDIGPPYSGIGISLNSGDVSGNFGNLITSSLAIGNAGAGMEASGAVNDSRADDNGGSGIDVAGLISNSVANDNGGYGLIGEIIINLTAKGNPIGIAGATVIDSDALGNGGDGIQARGGNAIGSTAKNNGGNGIVLSCPGSAVGNTAVNNAGGNLVISDNSCVLLDNKTH